MKQFILIESDIRAIWIGFDLLVDMTCVDYLRYRGAEHRFGLVYDLTNFTAILEEVRKKGPKAEEKALQFMYIFQSRLDEIRRRIREDEPSKPSTKLTTLGEAGSGAAERLSALQIPYDYLDKVFIGHLHADHFGSLGELFIGGALMGRQKPLRVWGPNGRTPELGTAYAVQKMKEMYTWDLAGRVGLVDFRGYSIEVNEFDYKAENAVIYEDNGVTIRSFPAIHSLDGPVSFSLEWNGLKFVFGSDSYPNKWFAEYAKDADLAVHECFVAVPDLVKKMRFTPEQALSVGTQIHTAPEAFGKVMQEIKPRMAVAYHFFKDFDTTAEVNDRIRTTYDGPLSLAEDFMVWNVTKDDIRVRMAVVEEHTWAPPLASKPELPQKTDRENYSKEMGIDVKSMGYSDFIKEGRWGAVDEANREIYEEASEKLGREFPYPEN